MQGHLELFLDSSADVAIERKRALLRFAASNEHFAGWAGQLFVSEGMLGFFYVDAVDDQDNLVCVDVSDDYDDITSPAEAMARRVFADGYITPVEGDFHVLVPLAAITKWVIW